MSWRKGKRPSRRPWGRVRLKVLERDGWRCQACGKVGRLEVDHIKPMEDGGAVYDLANLQTLCRGCHFDKSRGERTAQETPADVLAWRRYLTDHYMLCMGKD